MDCSLDPSAFLDDEDIDDSLGRTVLMSVWGTLWTTLVMALWASWPLVT